MIYFGSSLSDGNFRSESFKGLGIENKLDAPAYFDVYLKKGSLDLVVEDREFFEAELGDLGGTIAISLLQPNRKTEKT